MKKSIIGQSVEGRSLEAYQAGDSQLPTLLVLGGFHGDEPKSVYLAQCLIEALQNDSDLWCDAHWIIVPLVNPDGYEIRRRRNAHQVDLNRNFPTANWKRGKCHSRMFGGLASASEPETRAVIGLIEQHTPAAIVTIHSIGRHRHCNNYDGPGRNLAEAMSEYNQYPVTDSMGYPTPGSFGTWAGWERNIPTVTLELPSLRSSKQCWEENRQALASAANHVIMQPS